MPAGGAPAEGAPKEKHRVRNAFIVVVILAVIAAALALVWHFDVAGIQERFTGGGESTVAVGDLSNGGDGSESNDSASDFVMFGEGFNPEPIADADSARDAVGYVADALGIEDVAADLGECSESDALGNTYYKFPQQYNGVSVYGRAVSVGADGTGEALSLTSNYKAVSSAQTQPSLSEEEAKEALQGAVDGLDKLESEGLTIYSLNESEPTLCYMLCGGDIGDRKRYFVDATNGGVVAQLSLDYYETIQGKTLSGDKIDLPAKEVSSGEYSIDGSSQNAFYHDAQKKEIALGAPCQGFDENGHVYEIDTSEEGFFFFLDDKRNRLNKEEVGDGYYRLTDDAGNIIAQRAYLKCSVCSEGSALEEASGTKRWYWQRGKGAKAVVSAYKGVDGSLSFYADILQRSGYDGANGEIRAVANAKILNNNKRDNSTNAFSSDDLGPGTTLLVFGFKRNSIDTDLVAHEFTHSVEDSISGMQYERESGALMEATSDIFGELVEDYADGRMDNSCNWIHGDRDCAEPENTGNPAVYQGDKWGSIYESSDHGHIHGNSTVISHAAYVMVTDGFDGTALTTEELAKLLYEAFFSLPSDCTFSEYATIVTNIAERTLDDGKTQRVRFAFEQAGINRLQIGCVVNTSSKLVVYGADGEEYADYTCEVRDIDDDKVVATLDSESTDPLSLQFDESNISKSTKRYMLSVSDRGESNATYYAMVIVSYKGHADLQNIVEIYTDFRGEANSSGDNTTTGGDSSTTTQPVSGGAQDIALVLDVSGSMDGEPLEQTKEASARFVEVALDTAGVRVGAVRYSDEAETISTLNDNEASLKTTFSSLESLGGTDIGAGMQQAQSMLASSESAKKSIVLMTDGEPTGGMSEEELIAYADQIKASGVKIYTLGFNESVSGHELLSAMASEGCYYPVEDASSLEDFFADIASALNGTRFIYLRAACPVDVRVTYEGETLSSAEIDLNTRTSFGSLAFEDEEEQLDENDRVKVLRLKEGPSYDISIDGTGEGSMDYSIGFVDDNGDYNDFRTFSSVAINDATHIETVAEVAETTQMRIDEDGDGNFDKTLAAHANEEGQLVDNSWIVRAIFAACAIVAIVVVSIVVWRKLKKWQQRRDARARTVR